jgi:hypothetical protein
MTSINELNLIIQPSSSFWNNAVLAAALSAILVSVANSYQNDKKNKIITKQRQQQACSQLKAKNNIIEEVYKSYAEALFESKLEVSIRSVVGVPKDPIILKEADRWIRRVDKLSLDINIYYGNLLETLSIIQLIFDDKDNQLSNLVNKVIDLNRDFLEIVNKGSMICAFEGKLNTVLLPFKITPDGILRNQMQINSMHHVQSQKANEEIDEEIERCIKNPVKNC